MKGQVIISGKRMHAFVKTSSSREEVYYKCFREIYSNYGVSGIELFMVGVERQARKGGQFVPTELRLFGIGDFSESQVPIKAILAHLQGMVKGRAVALHNHPRSSVDICRPSSQDVKFHIKLQTILETSGVNLASFYIVSTGGMIEFDANGKYTVVYRDCSYVEDVVKNSPSKSVNLYEPSVAKEFLSVNAKTANGFVILSNRLAPIELCSLPMNSLIEDVAVIQRKMIDCRADRLMLYCSGKENLPHMETLMTAVSYSFDVIDVIELKSGYSLMSADAEDVAKEADKKARRRR